MLLTEDFQIVVSEGPKFNTPEKKWKKFIYNMTLVQTRFSLPSFSVIHTLMHYYTFLNNGTNLTAKLPARFIF